MISFKTDLRSCPRRFHGPWLTIFANAETTLIPLNMTKHVLEPMKQKTHGRISISQLKQVHP